MFRRRWIVAAVVALLLTASGMGWVWAADRTAGDVRVAWSNGSPSCTGTSARNTERGPLIVAKPQMRCTVKIQVTNNGSSKIHLTKAVAPFVGPDTGTVVVASNADSSASVGIDAVYDLDRTLDGGQTSSFEITIRFHPAGCNDSGTLTLPGWPAVSFTAWGRTFTEPSENDLRIYSGGPTPGCASLED